jgi:redox-sensing transcriptional repressor
MRAPADLIDGRASGNAEERMSTNRGSDVTADGDAPRHVPEATVARLATYLRVLTGMVEELIGTCSSEDLAAAAGVNSAMLRKDLSYLGSYGIRGVGYDVQSLTGQVARVLGLDVHRHVVLIGVGHLGTALAGYTGFASRGFTIAALVDADPSRIGSHINGLLVQDIGNLEAIVAQEKITIAVLAVPAAVAQQICDQLVAVGVTSILNFAPVVLSVPGHVDVRKVDLAAELQILSFHENRKAASAQIEAAQ